MFDITAKLAEQNIQLTQTEAQVIDNQVRSNAALKEQLALKQRLIPVEDQLAERTRIAVEAQRAGVITAKQLNQELANIDAAAAKAGKSFGDGWTRTLQAATEEANNMANALENALSASIDATADALADFATSGQLNFRKFAQSILKDIARIIARLLVLKAVEAIGNAVSSGAGSAGTTGAEAAAQDGSTAARANKPFLVGEEGPEIFTPGQTGSITPTDQTIEALAGGAANQRETVVVQAPAPMVNVQNNIIRDPNEIPRAIESPDGRAAVVNVIGEEKQAVNRTLA